MNIDWKIPDKEINISDGSFLLIESDGQNIIEIVGSYSNTIFHKYENEGYEIYDVGCGCCSAGHTLIGYLEPQDLTQEQSLYLLQHIGEKYDPTRND